MKFFIKIKFSLVILLFIFTNTLVGQNSNADATKEEKSLLKAARKDLANEKYEEAKVKYIKLTALNPKSDIYNYETGLSFYFSVFERSKSIPFFETALKNSNGDTIPEVQYYLGRAYHINSEYKKSKKTLTEFKSKINSTKEGQYLLNETKYRIGLDENGIEYEKEKNQTVIIKNLGTGINTIDREYAPVLRKEDHIIIFTSRREGSTGGKLASDMLPYEDIYVAKETAPESWSLVDDKNEISKYLPSGFNTSKHNAGVVYSMDGKTLYLYKKDMLWKSEKTEENWSELEKLGASVNESKLNIPSATVSQDGNTVYFVTTRKDGLGGEDIYRITKDTNTGEWNNPENLGVNINTEFDEDAPFLSKDGKIFYFSSKGHKGLGGYDIYRCDVINGELSKPINMGIPMNSPVDDIYLVIDDKNEVGFFSSDREGGHGAMDLYAFDMSCPNIENTEIRGLVYNKTDKIILESVLTLYDTNNTQVFETKSLASNGKFLIPTPPNQKYKLNIKTNGYKEQSFDITLPKQCEFFPLFIEVALELVMVDGQTYQIATIQNSFFNAEEAITIAQDNDVNIDTENITKEIPLTKIDSDNNFEADKNLMAFTRTLDLNNTNLNFNTISDTVKIEAQDTNLFVANNNYREEFGYNVININTTNTNYVKLIDEAIARLNKTGKKIVLSIESSASKVPTTTYKSNINLASLRGDEAKAIVLKSFKEKGVNEEMIEVNAINSLISGPDYNKDFKNSEKYKPYQYVIITIE